MAKLTLEFNLPEERSEADLALSAGKLNSIIYDWEQQLRAIVKYGDSKLTSEAQLEVVTELRRRWHDLLKEHEHDPYG